MDFERIAVIGIALLVVLIAFLLLYFITERKEKEKMYQKGRKESIGQPANLEELKVGGARNFRISMGPFLGNCPQAGNCSSEFFLLDFTNLTDGSAGMFFLELDITDKIDLKEAMGKIEEIEQGMMFGVNEKGQIEKLRF